MKNVLLTGAAGFIGQNLLVALRRREDIAVTTISKADDWSVLESALQNTDVIFHLAGVNRPETQEEFAEGNPGLTRKIIQELGRRDRKPKIVFPSSIQAKLDNPYGRSKKAAEAELLAYHSRTGAPIAIYQLPNVFGKWSRPNYNTVVATFCHNIARGLDITISDPNRELELVYIDDVVIAFLRHLDDETSRNQKRYTISSTFKVTLGELAGRIRQLHAIRSSLIVPDLADGLMKCLHATYLSFIPDKELGCPVKLHTDNRGWLFELLKSQNFGQIFVSKTLPGIKRGDHYHDTKLEKFCVVQGEAIIRFRHILSNTVLEYQVNGTDIRVVDIPSGYTHSIENTGQNEMICLFWANQIYSPEKPDTYWEKVEK